MKIGINLIAPADGDPNRDCRLLMDCFITLAKSHPEHQFVFFTNQNFEGKISIGKNISTVIVEKSFKKTLPFKYWLNFGLPALFKKQEIAIAIHLSGYCSMRITIPQIILLTDLPYITRFKFLAKNWLNFYKRNTEKFFHKATKILVGSRFVEQIIRQNYPIATDKIINIPLAANPYFKPLDQNINEATKDEFTDGKEYFLYSGLIHPKQNLMELLKAFSFFKKRQKSSMQLVIASPDPVADSSFFKKLETFKFKADVKCFENLNDETLARLYSAAYAFVYPSGNISSGLEILQAIQCGLPIISGRIGVVPEICGDAVSYVNPNDFNDIAEKMMLEYKNEKFREDLIQKSKNRSADFQFDKTLAFLWNAITG